MAKRTVTRVKRATTKRKKSTVKAKSAGSTKSKRAVASTVSAKKKSAKMSAKQTAKATLEKKAKRSAAAPQRASAKRSPAQGKVKKKTSPLGSVDKKAAPVKARALTVKEPATQAGPAATSQDPIQFIEERPVPKTRLRVKELRAFRDLLRKKRAELVGDVSRMSREALNTGGAAHGDRSAMPIHMADIGSDNWETEFTLDLVQNERELVLEIDDALERIKNKTYGVCLATHRPISDARLQAKPWAKYCIEYARAREEGRAI